MQRNMMPFLLCWGSSPNLLNTSGSGFALMSHSSAARIPVVHGGAAVARDGTLAPWP